MMRRLLLALVPFILASCSPDEPVISNYDPTWRYLVSTSDGLSTVRMPSGEFEVRDVWTGQSPFPVQRLYEFRDAIYALLTNGSIVVLNRTTLVASDTLDFAAEGGASGIAFANATTAYVTLPKAQQVGIVDLTVGQLVSVIDVEASCTDLAVLGNQIAVTVPDRNEVSFIDTRSNAITAAIPLPNRDPFRIVPVPATGTFAILCGGEASGSDPSAPLPAVIVINASTRQIVGTSTLSLRTSSNPRQRPFGIASNDVGFLYVPIEPSLMLVNSRSPSQNATPVAIEPYRSIRYHGARAEFVLVGADRRTLTVYDQFAEARRHRVTLADSVHDVLGLAP